ncbi:MAG: hypothetical protein ACRDIV_18020 [Ktedonobacteraceae bacterium]
MQHMNPEQQVTQGGCIRWLGFLLLGLGVIVGLLMFASVGKTPGGGNNSPQQLTSLDDVQQYVFDTMAKPVQDNRLKHPTYGRNLGMGQIVIEYADGSPISATTSGIITGEKGTDLDKNVNHVERKLHDAGGFIPTTLQDLQRSGELDKASKVYIFIFTQVSVCKLCGPEMRGWLNDFRAEVSPANQGKFDFQVWQPTFTFNPDDTRAKQRQMVSAEDITQVEIKFFPPPKPGKS